MTVNHGVAGSSPAQGAKANRKLRLAFFDCMNFVYIFYSAALYTFYVGETANLSPIVNWHNAKDFSHSYTVTANDWVVF